MRGRTIEIIVTLRGIERDILPELSDESARKLGFRSAEAMRLRAHEQAQDMARLHKRSRSLEGMQALLELWPGFDAPDAMVKQCTREAISRAAQQMQQRQQQAQQQYQQPQQPQQYQQPVYPQYPQQPGYPQEYPQAGYPANYQPNPSYPQEYPQAAPRAGRRSQRNSGQYDQYNQ